MLYNLTKSIDQRSLKFGLLYGKMWAFVQSSRWEDRVRTILQSKAAISAITIDKNIHQKFDMSRFMPEEDVINLAIGEKGYNEYRAYNEAKKFTFTNYKNNLTLSFIREIQSYIMSNKGGTVQLRKTKRIIPKEITDMGVVKQVNLEVKTSPANIFNKLDEFVEWFNKSKDTENPLIFAAMTHFKIIEIHPFDDGNGRLAKILENLALAISGELDPYLVPTEIFLLNWSDRYYDLIERTIETQNYTEWIEFYSEVALTALYESSKIIKSVTGGAINCEKNMKVDLTDIEAQILDILMSDNPPTPAEIGVSLGYSRQNIYRIIRLLSEKGLLQKQGTIYKLT